jgi:hypothetical protein
MTDETKAEFDARFAREMAEAIEGMRKVGIVTMPNNPRNYPDTMASAESGRPMMRGEKLVTFKIEGRAFTYKQPGWWCSLTDPDDLEGQLVDDDHEVAEMARRIAKACTSNTDD